MYIVRFRDKHHDIDSEVTFNNYAEAIAYVRTYKNDSSNLYSNISILDAGQNLVLIIILFDKTGQITAEFHDRSIVKFKKAYQQNPNEEHDRYWITNIHDEYERCLANYIDDDHKYAFGSSHNYDLELLEVVVL